MTEILAIIGIIAIFFVIFKITSGIRARNAFQRIYIDGKRTSINKLFVEVAHSLQLSTDLTVRLSPIVFASSVDIRQEIYKGEVPYQAVIAYWLSGSLLSLSAQARIAGDDMAAQGFVGLSQHAKQYADSLVLDDI